MEKVTINYLLGFTKKLRKPLIDKATYEGTGVEAQSNEDSTHGSFCSILLPIKNLLIASFDLHIKL